MQNVSWKLIGVLVILVIATYFVLRQPGEVSISGSTGKFLVEYDSASIDKMEVNAQGKHATLAKEAGVWMIVSPISSKADQNAIGSAVGKGRSLEVSKPISSNPEKQHLFQVDSSGTLVKFFEKGNERAAIRIGKAGSSYTDTYVRLEGSPDVYLTEGILSSIFARELRDWRDKTIFRMGKEFIKTVQFQYGDTTFALTLQDSVWRIDGASALESMVSSLVNSISDFQADEFVDTAIAAPPRLTGAITVEGTQIKFYAQKDGTKYYVQTSASPQWFEVYSWKANQLLKRMKDLVVKA